MDKQEEIWRAVKNHEGLYEVSNRGRVRSVGHWVNGKAGSKQFREGRILKPKRGKNGYLHVGLSRNGKYRNFLIHRLVAEVFIPNPEGKPQVNHIDECKTNNDVSNLEWATRKENINFGTGIKRRAASQSKAVLALDPKTGQVAFEFSSAKDAEQNGFNSGAISACCNGKNLSHRGLVWKFKDDYDQENAWIPVKIGGAASQSKPVQALDPKTGLVVLEFPSTAEAGRNGLNQGNISSCCNGKILTHKGYRWRFKPVSNYSRMLEIYDIALEQYRKKTKTA